MEIINRINWVNRIKGALVKIALCFTLVVIFLLAVFFLGVVALIIAPEAVPFNKQIIVYGFFTCAMTLATIWFLAGSIGMADVNGDI